MKSRKRAIRRHHNKRLKSKRCLYHCFGDDKPLEGAALGLALNNPARCSCPVCGNPRRHFGELTIQEKKRRINIEQELVDE